MPTPFQYDTNLIPKEPNFFSAGFKLDKIDKYVSFVKKTFHFSNNNQINVKISQNGLQCQKYYRDHRFKKHSFWKIVKAEQNKS